MAHDAPLPLLAPAPSSPAPRVPCLALDTVWFQVAGTLCNLACRHCFISCNPTNHSHELMSRTVVRRYRQAATLGVKVSTGGRFSIASWPVGTLRIGPTVLTKRRSSPRPRRRVRVARPRGYSLS
jgi:hypothetical protein